MDGLISLVRTMRPSEKRLLMHHYARNSNSEQKVRLKLFRLVDKGVSSDDDAKEKLGSKPSASAFSHLKRRLKDDILNILLMQDTSKRFAQANRAAELDCRKKVAQSHLLLLRGAHIEGMKVLQDALKTSEKFELLAERLQINHLLREMYVGPDSSLQFVKLNKEISKDLVKYEALLKVQEKSFTLSSAEFAQKLRKRSYDKQNIALIDELKGLYRKHKLARIGFWYYMAATEFENARGNFESVVQLGLEFLKLVEKSPAVKSKNNIAGVNQTCGVANMELRVYEKAISHLRKAETFFPAAGFNRLQCLQFLVQVEVAHQSYDSAIQHVQMALEHPRINTRERFIARWSYFIACIEFLKGNIDASFTTLNQNGYLIKQIDDWNVQYRFLEMMQLVEQGDQEWLEFKLDATRKFLTRHKALSTERTRLFIDLITFLVRNELEPVNLSEPLKMRLLDSLEESKDFEWNPTGPELVRFDRWFSEKYSVFQESTESA